MRRAWPLLMAALVALFFAQGQRAFFASLFILTRDALTPAFHLGPAAIALLPLLALFAPLLPLARWLDRHTAVVVAAVGAAVFRLPLGHPSLVTRALGGALVLACAAMFLKWAVGLVGRRALGAGFILGLVADQLLRTAGSGHDISLRPSWLPVQVILSLGLVAAVLLWRRDPARSGGRNELERRSGGLRLRGGLALGGIFFLDLHLLGVAPVIARWTGAEYPLAAALVGVAGAAAFGGALLLRRPTGGRMVTLLLAGLITASALLGHWLDGSVVAGFMAVGHLAALLLITRAFDPASGRRSGTPVTAGLVLFVLLTVLFDLALRPASPAPWIGNVVPWILVATGVLLAACFILLPRPEPLGPPDRPLPGALLVAGIAGVALVLALQGDREPVAGENTSGGEWPGASRSAAEVPALALLEHHADRHFAHARSADTFQRPR